MLHLAECRCSVLFPRSVVGLEKNAGKLARGRRKMITATAQRPRGGSEDYSTPLISPKTSPVLSGAAVAMRDPCLSHDQAAMNLRVEACMGDGDLDRSQELRVVAEVRYRGTGWVLMVCKVQGSNNRYYARAINECRFGFSCYSCCVTDGPSLSWAVNVESSHEVDSTAELNTKE